MRVRGSFAFGLPAVLGLALFGLSACASGDTPNTLVPTIITPPSKTEIFTGTVQVGNSDVHAFTLSAGGTVSITLTAAGPPATIVMGLGIGNIDVITQSCVLLSNGVVNTAAGATPQVSGSTPSGSYCVAVFDVGNQSGPVSYSVTVVHP